MKPHPPPAAPGLASRDFLLLWAVGGIGNAMRWLEVLAAALFTLDATGSQLAVAVVAAARSLPLIFTGALAGVLADAFDRRVIIIIGMTASGLASGVVALLAWAGLLLPWHMFATGLVTGLVFGNDLSVRRRMIGESVAPTLAARAIALDSLTTSVSRVLGPLIGGVAYEFLGLTGTFAASALLNLTAALLAVPVRHAQQRRRLAPAAVLADLAEAVAVARRSSVLLALLAVTVAQNMFGFAYTSLIAPAGRDVFAVSATLVGVLAAAEPMGAVLGGLGLAAGVAVPGRPIWVFLGSSAWFLAALALIAAVPWFWAAAAMLLVGGLGLAVYSNEQVTIALGRDAGGGALARHGAGDHRDRLLAGGHAAGRLARRPHRTAARDGGAGGGGAAVAGGGGGEIRPAGSLAGRPRLAARTPRSYKPSSVCAPGHLGHARPRRVRAFRARATEKETKMPKLKTKSSVKKRFKITATGKVLAGPGKKRHGLINRPQKMKRQNRGSQTLTPQDAHDRQAVGPLRARVREIAHGTRQTGHHHPRPSQEGPGAVQGLRRPLLHQLSHRAGAAGEVAAVRLSRPAEEEARFPRPVDPAHQRRGARARADLLAIYRRAEARPGSRWTARCWPPSPTTIRRASPRSSRRCRPPWPDRAANRARDRTAEGLPATSGGPFACTDRIDDRRSASPAQPRPRRRCAAAADLRAWDAVRVAVLGHNGTLTALLQANSARVPPEQRRERGAALNRLKDALAAAIEARRAGAGGRRRSMRASPPSASTRPCRRARARRADPSDQPHHGGNRRDLRRHGLRHRRGAGRRERLAQFRRAQHPRAPSGARRP